MIHDSGVDVVGLAYANFVARSDYRPKKVKTAKDVSNPVASSRGREYGKERGMAQSIVHSKPFENVGATFWYHFGDLYRCCRGVCSAWHY